MSTEAVFPFPIKSRTTTPTSSFNRSTVVWALDLLDLLFGDDGDIGRDLSDLLNISCGGDDHLFEGHLLFLCKEAEWKENEKD